MKQTIEDSSGLKFYTLQGKDVVRTDKQTFFADLVNLAKRQIRHTRISGKIEVSTVFLGLNHGLSEDDPLFFETMVFGGQFDSQAFRTSTYDEAESMHHAIVEKVKTMKRAWYAPDLHA